MCGIIGYVGKKDIPSVIFDGLRRLEYRGYDSAGVAYAIQGGSVVSQKAVGRVKNLRTTHLPPANIEAAIGHTRWATHGKVNLENSHPHSSDNLTLVHNGVIDNADGLRKKLEDLGYLFLSDTDSEVIAHLIDYNYSGNGREAIEKAVKFLVGTYGLAIMFHQTPGRIFLAKNGSPLVIGIGKDSDYFLASDTNALIQYTDNFIYMEDGDIAMLNYNTDIYLNNDRQVCKVSQKDAYAELGNYKHFMLKEIFEQPKAIKRCLSTRIGTSRCRPKGFNLAEEQLHNTNSVTILGCGTSYHAGLLAKQYIEKWAEIPCFVELASEFANKDFIHQKNGLYLAISQSGETYDTIECIKELKKKGIKVYGVVNTVGSTIARMCDGGIYIHAGPEISVASTKAFSTQLVALIMFASMLGRSKTMGLAEGTKLVGNLNMLSFRLEAHLYKLNKRVKLLRTIAKEIKDAPYILFLGRGNSYPVAMEGALKLKEIAYIPCEAYASGEMKHGPIAMIEEGTPVICVMPEEKNLPRMIANIEEVKARGAKIIMVGEWDDSYARLATHALTIPPKTLVLSPFYTVICLQLLAYYVALELGYDIDKPRNLAKAVTV